MSGELSGSDRALAMISASDMGGNGGESCGVSINKEYSAMPHLSNGREDFQSRPNCFFIDIT